jgi:glutamate carboxypeptidase
MQAEALFAELDRRLADEKLRMIDALGALVGANSFSDHREGGVAVAALLDEVFAPAGLERTVTPSARYADHRTYASASSIAANPVLLVGHFDTVFPPGTFEGMRFDGDLLRGPGVLDMKGGLVVVAFALRALANVVGLDRVVPVRVVAVSDEEVGSLEGKEVIRTAAANVDAALVFEAGRAEDRIVTARKGTGMVTVHATGRAAHAGANHADGRNAIWALARWIDGAQALTNYATGVTVTVGVVSGGTAHNVVPAEARCEVDLRFETRADGEATLSAFDRLARELTDAMEGISLRVDGRLNRMPLERTREGLALLEQYAAQARLVGLGSAEAPLIGGASDANTTAGLGIATIDGLGPRGKGFHTLDEQIDVRTLVPKAQALARFLLARTLRGS